MRNVRRGMLLGLVLLTLAVTLSLVVRWALRPGDVGPAIEIVRRNGETRRVSLPEMKRLPQIVRRGEAQNQYGNWRDGGTYTGVLLVDLLDGEDYTAIEALASDGYRVIIERSRVEDAAFPMVVAYDVDGVSVPTWQDGFRIVVLPESGRVGNEEYRTTSAGSFWVKSVERLVLR